MDVRLVVSLACTEETVLQRIAGNLGGDRGRRSDDSQEAVRRKLEIFRQRTAPLLDYYRSRGTPLRQIEVRAETTAEETWHEVAAWQEPTDCKPPS